MRRLIIVVLAGVSALTLISFAALAASAQTEPSDQYATEDTLPQESTTPPEETTGDPEPYHQVVDNATAGSFEAPGWQVGRANDNTFGEDYAYADPSDDIGPARFTVDIPEADHYAVFARWPGGADVTTSAHFDIETASGTSSDEIDQRTDAGLWVLIGIYDMEPGQRAIQIARSPSGDGRLVADAVMVVGGALVGADGQTATTANPDELAGDGPVATGGDTTFSADGGGRPTGRDVVRKAKNYIGVRYKWGECDPMRLMSCTCLTKKTYAKFGHKLPMTERGQWKYDRSRRISRSNLKPGDEVFFTNNNGRINHVGVYAGNGKLVHGSTFCDKVCIGEMRYVNDYFGAKRYRLR
jgi:cell wall-associated NlpC family hydrolase